jgi:outer membrane biosynthesis protein TonB
MWTAMGVLLLGFAMGSGPKHRLMPQSHVAAVAAATKPVSSTVAIPAKASAESAPSVASVPATAAESSSLPHFHLPDAMARDVSLPETMTPYSRVAVRTRAPGKPEVMIRVSVDREGRALAFKIVRGDRKKISAALDAARRWSFQPCPGSADCEHVLKVTDYGDATSVQIIE